MVGTGKEIALRMVSHYLTYTVPLNKQNWACEVNLLTNEIVGGEFKNQQLSKTGSLWPFSCYDSGFNAI